MINLTFKKVHGTQNLTREAIYGEDVKVLIRKQHDNTYRRIIGVLYGDGFVKYDLDNATYHDTYKEAKQIKRIKVRHLREWIQDFGN